MNALIRQFAQNYSLTPRETDILTQLVNRVTNFKEIAEKLGVSPNTVSNHFGSIFHKTSTNSKSELMAVFIKFILKQERNCDHFHRQPVILIVDDESEICELIGDYMENRGVKTICCTSASEALEQIKKRQIDVIVSDIRMPQMDGVAFLKEVRRLHPYYPAFIFITGFSGEHSIESVLNLGAVALLDKPLNMEKLFETIMEQYVDDPHFRDRHERVKTSDIAIQIDSKLTLKLGDIGYGGVFIPDTENRYKVGDKIHFEFSLGDAPKTIRATGEVVWARVSSHVVDGKDCEPGIGVKFLDLGINDREFIEEYVRFHKVLSFIPLGPSED